MPPSQSPLGTRHYQQFLKHLWSILEPFWKLSLEKNAWSSHYFLRNLCYLYDIFISTTFEGQLFVISWNNQHRESNFITFWLHRLPFFDRQRSIYELILNIWGGNNQSRSFYTFSTDLIFSINLILILFVSMIFDFYLISLFVS